MEFQPSPPLLQLQALQWHTYRSVCLCVSERQRKRERTCIFMYTYTVPNIHLVCTPKRTQTSSLLLQLQALRCTSATMAYLSKSFSVCPRDNAKQSIYTYAHICVYIYINESIFMYIYSCIMYI